MIAVLERLDKPEYFHRPAQVLRRWWRRGSRGGRTEVVLPWGLPLRVDTREDIGRAIWKLGIYDLTVSEALWRLCDEGDLTIDAGANIGHMTSIMAYRCGRRGRVLAFEPHPAIYAELEQNVAAWQKVAPVELRQLGLSNCEGKGKVFEPTDFCSNRGTAQVHPSMHGGVQLVRLDDEVGTNKHVGVLKIDVEGSELDVLEGATRLLKAGLIRDIVFEDFTPQPSRSTKFLETFGYHVFSTGRSFMGPRLTDSHRHNPTWLPPSFLATLDTARAITRMKPRGWQALSRS